MTNTIPTEINVVVHSHRKTPAERRAHWRNQRRAKIRTMLYNFVCWLQGIVPSVQKNIRRLPSKIMRGILQVAFCTIVLILVAAAFFAACGVLYMALQFWAQCYGY